MQEGRKVVGDICPKNAIHATTSVLLVEIYELYEILALRTCLAWHDSISLKTNTPSPVYSEVIHTS